MNRLSLTDWCEVESTAKLGPWPRGYRPVADLLLVRQEPPLDLVLKCWGGLLHALNWLHEQSRPPRLLLRGVEPWAVKHPWTNKAGSSGSTQSRSRFPWLRLFQGNVDGLDRLAGDFLARFGPDLTLFPTDAPLPHDFRADRFSAPEATGGAVVTPAADVFYAAALTLALATGTPIAAHAGDVPIALQALRLLRPDLPVPVTALLEVCLDPDPAARPASPAEAFERLSRMVAELAVQLAKPWRVLAGPPICHRRVALGQQKYEEAITSFLDVQTAHEDELLYERLAENLLVAAVFDGVSRTDVGTGAFAAAHAREAVLAELTRSLRQKRVKQRWPTPESSSAEVFEWLSGLSATALRRAHEEIVRQVVGEFGPQLRPGRHTPETTATLALVFGDHAVISWVGDSPALLADATGVMAATAPTTAGLQAVCDSRNAGAYGATSAPQALTETLGALLIQLEGETELRVVEASLRIRQTPLRLDDGVLLVLATDGVSDYLGPDAAACRAFAAENARRGWRDSTDPGETVGRLFEALWQKSEQERSPDDRTLLVLGGRFTPPSATGEGEPPGQQPGQT